MDKYAELELEVLDRRSTDYGGGAELDIVNGGKILITL